MTSSFKGTSTASKNTISAVNLIISGRVIGQVFSATASWPRGPEFESPGRVDFFSFLLCSSASLKLVPHRNAALPITLKKMDAWLRSLDQNKQIKHLIGRKLYKGEKLLAWNCQIIHKFSYCKCDQNIAILISLSTITSWTSKEHHWMGIRIWLKLFLRPTLS